MRERGNGFPTLYVTYYLFRYSFLPDVDPFQKNQVPTLDGHFEVLRSVIPKYIVDRFKKVSQLNAIKLIIISHHGIKHK